MPDDLADRLHQLIEQADDASTVAERAEAVAALKHCLEKLSQAERRLVSARYEEGCRITQIAERTNQNVATARVRLFRIRQSLKTCVETTLAGGVIS